MEELDFGKRLIEARKAKGLTQDEVAEMCNLTVRTIQRIESGSVKPRAFTIKIIAEVLEFDFFETSNTNYDANKKDQPSTPNKSAILWYLKDLFNLKQNAMKKISILTTFFLTVVLAGFTLVSETKAQSVQAEKRPNYTITKDRIEVAFTHAFTFDSLVYIKDVLKDKGIIIHYKKVEFDEKNQLSSIDLNVDCGDGYSGSFSTGQRGLADPKIRFGFYRDYSKNAKSTFGTGSLDN